MFVFQAVADALEAAGVTTLFGLIGDANLFMVDSFVRRNEGCYISAAHEASAVMMAAGYAARSGGLGVATVTQGPGLTNTATALVESARNSSPILLVVGDTAPSNTLNQQSLDQRTFVEATGVWYSVTPSPREAAATVFRAAQLALEHSHPVVVNIPTEYQWVEVDEAQTFQAAPKAPHPTLDEASIEAATGVIAGARRPIVLAGRGVTRSPQREAVLAFAQRIGAPLATTLRARNLYSVADGSVGIFGTLSNDVGAQVISDADCVVVFGASLNTWTTDRNALLAGKRVVHVDCDPAKLNRNYTAETTVLGEAAAVIEALTGLLDTAEIEPTSYRRTTTATLEESQMRFAEPPRDRITFGGVLQTVAESLGITPTVTFDGGRFLGEAFKYMQSRSFASQVLTTSFGAVGLGMGAAIGAARAAPDEPTVLVTGDGGFMMNGLAELHSAIRAGLPLIVVICNDGSYGAEYDQYVNKGLDPELSLFAWPSFVALAESLGANGLSVSEVADLDPVRKALAKPVTQCLVIDVQVKAADVAEVPH
jgi:acetolactate synthase I/II/III large subunit